MKTFEPINGRMLSNEEIKERLDAFNENVPYDWSLFEGAHVSQQICFMYPFYIKPITINMAKQYQEPTYPSSGVSPEGMQNIIDRNA